MMEVEALLSAMDSEQGLTVLRRYIDEGGDLDYQNPVNGWSLLHYACEHENTMLITEIIRAGCDPDKVARCGYPAIFQAMDIDIDGAIQNRLPITFSITLHLLRCGAAPGLRDHKGRTLREYAGGYGPSVVKTFDELVGAAVD